MADAGGLTARRVGEVVAAASTSFFAQCYQLYGAPALGSFVRTGSPWVYEVVCRVSTEPLDPSRPVLARGESASSEEEVFRDNPQLARLLTTRFDALIAGHQAGDECRHFLPPLPPPVHSFVYACSPAEMARFTDRLDFIYLLLNSGAPVVDEVVGACLRAAAGAQPDGAGFLVRAGRALASELAGDVPQLNSILRRVAP
ncbi:MAG: hypothetical protein QF659_04950 [Dehalococcoidia bacterium]|nr:hypothetical protein [Dehalococcoidia bacterium]